MKSVDAAIARGMTVAATLELERARLAAALSAIVRIGGLKAGEAACASALRNLRERSPS